MPNPETNARATCSICQRPMTIAKGETRGSPMHGQCWLDRLREQWRAETRPKAKAHLEMMGKAVAKSLAEYHEKG